MLVYHERMGIPCGFLDISDLDEGGTGTLFYSRKKTGSKLGEYNRIVKVILWEKADTPNDELLRD